VPAIPSCIIEPIWDQVAALLPPPSVDHPLGCHRPRIPDRVVFDKLVQVLVFGCAYWRIADATCSATTLRRRRDAWIDAGVMSQLSTLVLAAYDRMIGLELADLAVDGCITKAPCGGEVAGRSPVDRGKQGIKRSTVVEAQGIPLGAIAAPANRHDSPLLEPTLDTLAALEPLPAAMTIHLDRGYDSGVTREHLGARGLVAAISPKGKPAPLAATQRWSWNGPTPGPMPTRKWSGASRAGPAWLHAGSPSPPWSSSWTGSFARRGRAIAGTVGHPGNLERRPYWRKLLECIS